MSVDDMDTGELRQEIAQTSIALYQARQTVSDLEEQLEQLHREADERGLGYT